MREALRLGDSRGRVKLGEACAGGHAYGVGALEGLSGEITIVDGVVWIARVNGEGEAVTSKMADESGAAPEATLLAVSHVEKWIETRLENDLSLAALEERVREAGVRAGLDGSSGFVFTVEGLVSRVDLHVINGSCPMAAGSESDEALHRARLVDRRVVLVGIYYEGAPGELTHHGSRTHVHVLATGEAPISGHVDDVVVRGGGVLSVPVGRSGD